MAQGPGCAIGLYQLPAATPYHYRYHFHFDLMHTHQGVVSISQQPMLDLLKTMQAQAGNESDLLMPLFS